MMGSFTDHLKCAYNRIGKQPVSVQIYTLFA